MSLVRYRVLKVAAFVSTFLFVLAGIAYLASFQKPRLFCRAEYAESGDWLRSSTKAFLLARNRVCILFLKNAVRIENRPSDAFKTSPFQSPEFSDLRDDPKLKELDQAPFRLTNELIVRAWLGEMLHARVSPNILQSMGFRYNRETASDEQSDFDCTAMSVPLWFLMVVSAIWASSLRRRRLLQRGTRAWFCNNCGYDLRGSGERCPECGTLR
jgi:hypothetical protein